jgi:hyaluronan synthase
VNHSANSSPDWSSEARTASSPPSRLASQAWDWFLRVAIIVGIVGFAYEGVFRHLIDETLTDAEQSKWKLAIERPSLLWAAMGTLLITLRTLLWSLYRSAPAATFEGAPSLTVVIPAFNEGAMVAQSVDSAAACVYPRDRLEIFVIDDGSTDDTWEHIERAAARHPGLVTPIRFEKNRGKRAALAAGFERARGEVVVTMDSDSVIDAQALLELAGAIAEPGVGAVAGKVAVYNRHEGLIPEMLHVRFILSFDLLRAVQSTYGTVYCCPGALTAYRADVLRRVLPVWKAQTFMGVPCTIGEDRALTNLILAEGMNTRYQRSAVVHTVVPTTYDRLCRMLIRWDRSFIREEIAFARIVWKRPWAARAAAILDSFTTNLRYPVGIASSILLVGLAISDPVVLVRVMVAIGVMSLINMLYFLRSEASWAFLYGVLYAYFSFVALTWIFPYSAVTVRNRGWLTR